MQVLSVERQKDKTHRREQCQLDEQHTGCVCVCVSETDRFRWLLAHLALGVGGSSDVLGTALSLAVSQPLLSLLLC